MRGQQRLHRQRQPVAVDAAVPWDRARHEGQADRRRGRQGDGNHEPDGRRQRERDYGIGRQLRARPRARHLHARRYRHPRAAASRPAGGRRLAHGHVLRHGPRRRQVRADDRRVRARRGELPLFAARLRGAERRDHAGHPGHHLGYAGHGPGARLRGHAWRLVHRRAARQGRSDGRPVLRGRRRTTPTRSRRTRRPSCTATAAPRARCRSSREARCRPPAGRSGSGPRWRPTGPCPTARTRSRCRRRGPSTVR